MARNPLEAHRIAPSTRKVPEPNTLPTETEVARMLAGVRQPVSNRLLEIFDEGAREIAPTMGEVMWTIALLQARCLASAEMGNQQVWTAARFSELVTLALPAMMLVVERAKHQGDGKPPNDA